MTYQLRALKQKDSSGMLEWMHDPTINYLYTDKIRNATVESVEKFITDAEEQMYQRQTCHYAIVDKSEKYRGCKRSRVRGQYAWQISGKGYCIVGDSGNIKDCI